MAPPLHPGKLFGCFGFMLRINVSLNDEMSSYECWCIRPNLTAKSSVFVLKLSSAVRSSINANAPVPLMVTHVHVHVWQLNLWLQVFDCALSRLCRQLITNIVWLIFGWIRWPKFNVRTYIHIEHRQKLMSYQLISKIVWMCVHDREKHSMKVCVNG